MQNSAFLFIHLLTFLRKLCIFFLGWSKDPGPSTGEEVPRFFCGEMLLEGTGKALTLRIKKGDPRLRGDDEKGEYQ